MRGFKDCPTRENPESFFLMFAYTRRPLRGNRRIDIDASPGDDNPGDACMRRPYETPEFPIHFSRLPVGAQHAAPCYNRNAHHQQPDIVRSSVGATHGSPLWHGQPGCNIGARPCYVQPLWGLGAACCAPTSSRRLRRPYGTQKPQRLFFTACGDFQPTPSREIRD